VRGDSFPHGCNLVVKGLLLTEPGLALGRTETRYWAAPLDWSRPHHDGTRPICHNPPCVDATDSHGESRHGLTGRLRDVVPSSIAKP
jgi:hypothetical protein